MTRMTLNQLKHFSVFSILGKTTLLLVLCSFLSSCFTGVEGTKKITLSRSDRRNSMPSDEELFFSGISGEPLSSWKEGIKEFIAVDNKAALLFDSYTGPYFSFENHPDSSYFEGKKFVFQGIQSRIDAAGKLNAVIQFKDAERTFYYNTGKEYESALQDFKSDQIPMMIDLDLVDEAGDLLIGKELWTRSPLWYDSLGNRIEGKKYVDVKIMDVSPGNFVFPLKLKIKDSSGNEAYMFMNYGNSGNESRSFHNLFSLNNIKKHYPNVSQSNWDLICEGKVTYGMTKEECKLALGNPSDVNVGHDYSQTLDIWNYENGIILWFMDGVLTRFRI